MDITAELTDHAGPRPDQLVNGTILRRFYDDTLEFWQAFQLPIKRSFADLDYQTCQLAENLIKEEFNELNTSATNHEQLDALVDLIYVLAGGMHCCGLGAELFDSVDLTEKNMRRAFTAVLKTLSGLAKRPLPCQCSITWYMPDAIAGFAYQATFKYPLFLTAWKTVHHANMSKLWTERDVLNSLPADAMPYPVSMHDADKTIKYLVKRKPDGKILKPPGFTPPDLSPYIIPRWEIA